MAEIWAVAAAVIGAGAAVYGSSQQRVASNRANDANQRMQGEQNSAQWNNWLISRGMAPTTPVAPGEMPAAGNYSAVNTRLPLWANVTMPVRPPSGGAAVPFLVPRNNSAGGGT